MSRPLRIEFPGAVYHFTSQGNARQPVFHNNSDRINFLTLFYLNTGALSTFLLVSWCPGALVLYLFQQGGIFFRKLTCYKIFSTHICYGYSLKEINAFLGIHYTAVSKILKNKNSREK